MKRLFAALKIEATPVFIRTFQDLSTGLRHESIKWVEPQNIHITLKFFGETDEKKIPFIYQALQKAAGQSEGFVLKINRTGIFGSRYDPRVIWFGIDPEPQLSRLAENTARELENAGWQADRQNFVPHLTIGRIREIRDKALFQQVIDRFREVKIQEQPIREICLYESILRREGPLYIKLASFGLNKPHELIQE